MKIKIVLTSGKELELTKEEFEELKSNFKEIIYQTIPVQGQPYWGVDDRPNPYSPSPYSPITVTC